MIIWNPHGFHVIGKLRNQTKKSSDYFLKKLRSPLEQAIFPRGRVGHQKRLVVYLDNCSVRTNRASIDWLEEHGMPCRPQSAIHPICFIWPPGIFILFLPVKEKLERIQVCQEDQPFDCTQEMCEALTITN
jgi:hypothetical protein